jgi:hypothetical protein
MVTCLSDPDKVFRNSLVGSPVELCNLLPHLNMTDDLLLEDMRREIEAKLINHSPDTCVLTHTFVRRSQPTPKPFSRKWASSSMPNKADQQTCWLPNEEQGLGPAPRSVASQQPKEDAVTRADLIREARCLFDGCMAEENPEYLRGMVELIAGVSGLPGVASSDIDCMIEAEITKEFDRDVLHDYVVAQGFGPPTEEGYLYGWQSLNSGYDMASTAHEIVFRKMTEALTE